MTDKELTIGTGLVPNTPDARDFSHDAVFGSATAEELPQDDFFVSEPVGIKNQDEKFRSDFCAGYAGSAVREDQEMVQLNPEFTWMAAKRALGGEAWKSWGISLRDLAKAGCEVGFLEQEYYPFENREDVDRDFIANPANWAPMYDELAMLAAEHRANTFFAADGPYDTFDNFRSVMWKNKLEQRSILTGVAWRQSWTDAPGGIIEDRDYSDEKGFGHAIKIFGQMAIDRPFGNAASPSGDPVRQVREIYLVAQLSNGAAIGDKGLFYIPRSVVNKEFTFGAYTFKDMSKEVAKYHAVNKIRVGDSPWTKLVRVLVTFFTRFFKK